MQPPTYTRVPLRLQLEQLKQEAQHVTYTPPSNQVAKLHGHIATWLESMTPEQRKRRFTIEEAERLAGLQGKHGGRAAHHHIAQALRGLGFVQGRDWTVAGRNKRYWLYTQE